MDGCGLTSIVKLDFGVELGKESSSQVELFETLVRLTLLGEVVNEVNGNLVNDSGRGKAGDGGCDESTHEK